MEKEYKHTDNVRMTNKQWIDFLCFQFDISRTVAKKMLHVMMEVKRRDNIMKQFLGMNCPSNGLDCENCPQYGVRCMTK